MAIKLYNLVVTKRVFFIHGWEGYPKEGWRPWMRKELEKKDFKVFNPLMPNTMHPKQNEWVNNLKKIVGKADENCYFVGHSLGCIALLRYFETLTKGEKVGGCILVSGFSEDLGKGFEELLSFHKKAVNWKHVRKVCDKFTVIHSRDDLWVPIKFGENLKEKLKAEYLPVQGMKHFSGDDGITKAPVVLESLLKITK